MCAACLSRKRPTSFRPGKMTPTYGFASRGIAFRIRLDKSKGDFIGISDVVNCRGLRPECGAADCGGWFPKQTQEIVKRRWNRPARSQRRGLAENIIQSVQLGDG